MGGKYAGKRKRVFIYYTCLLVISLLGTGCSTVVDSKKGTEAHRLLSSAERLTTEGKYKAAMERTDTALSLSLFGPPGDYALFRMGLLWAHPDNLQKDYKRSLICFERLIKEFPQSELRMRAEIWRHAIVEIVHSDKEIKLLKGALNDFKKRLKKEALAINTMKEQLKKLKELDIVTEEKKRARFPTEQVIKNAK